MAVPFLLSVALDDDTPSSGYPFELAAVRQIEALELAPITVLAGDNGTGKSTIVEAVAIAAGFNAEGGGRNLRFETHATHSPFLMAFPGAAVFELSDEGIDRVAFDDLNTTVLWRMFLDDPRRLYERLLAEDDGAG